MNTLRLNYLYQPYEVSLETLTMCNAACTFCPYPTLERKGTELPDELVAKVIDEIQDFERPFFFSPFKVNEPFLDRRLIDICQRVTANEVASLRLFTNGHALTDAKLREVNNLRNVAHLWVSLNSHDPDEYQRIMLLPWIRIQNRLDILHKMVAWGEFTHYVVVSKVSTKVSEYEFLEFCRDRWPCFQVVLIKQDGWLGYVEPSSPLIPDTPCARWFELSILSTGIVSLCCMDGKGEFPIGNISKQSLLEIYNSPHWRDRREQMISRRLVHPCATCTY